MKQRLRAWAIAILAAGWLAGWGGALLAQEAAPQRVDSLDSYRTRIEGLISERLSTLLPGGNYVVRATVEGAREAVPRAAVAGVSLDLPGFRPASGESVTGETKFRVNQILVRIVLNQDVPQTDLQYIRTIVPILADFRADRGDRLDLQVIPAGAQARGGESSGGGPLDLNRPPFGVTWQEWGVIVGLMVLLFALLVMIVRLAIPRASVERSQAPAPPPLPPAVVAAREEAALSASEQRKQDQERQHTELKHAVIKRLFARPDLARDLLVEWAGSPNKMQDLAAALGPNIARQALLPQLGREAYQELEEKVLSAKGPDVSRQITALRDANGYLTAQEILRPEEVLPNPFRFLDGLTWGQVAHLIKDEPVKVKAIVLSRMKADDTARILERLPKDMQLEIAVNIGNLHDLPLEMAESVATDLAEKARHAPDPRLVAIEGPMALVDLMGRTSSATSRYLLTAMKSKDARLSQEVERRFFMFEAIPLVPDELIPQAVRTMSSNVVIQAMQGASPELQRKVIMAFPENARPGLVTALRASRADPEAVQEARRQVVAKFQDLGRQGRIDLKQISDAWQAQVKAS